MKKKLILLITVASLTFLATNAQNVEQGNIARRGCRPMANQLSNARHKEALRAKNAFQTEGKYIGERHQLTVLAAFNDKQFLGDEEATIQQWGKIFNAESFNEDQFVGSVSDYFRAQSYNQFDVTFDLQYVALSHPCSRYRSTSNEDNNSRHLVNDIVDELLTRDIDWSRYDWDGDGNIDQLLILYAGKGMNDGGDRNTIWPHQSWISEHTDDRTGEYLKPRVVTYNDKEYTIDCYCAVQEIDGLGTYGTFGTICHEYSHCFGFPDLYYGSMSFVYDWDIMDNGNYNGGGFCPAGYSAQERMLMGWLTPVELTATTSVAEMAALSDEPVAYIIRNDGHSDEYYILENRQQKGWDEQLPGSGLLIIHMNYYKEEWTGVSYCPNFPGERHYVIIPASNSPYFGRYSLAGWPYPYGDNNQLTNTSTPASTLSYANVDGAMLMSKPLTNISIDNGTVSFDFMNDISGISTLDPKCGPVKILYQMGPIQILRTADGKVIKTVRSQ